MHSEFYPPRKKRALASPSGHPARPVTQKRSVSTTDKWRIASQYGWLRLTIKLILDPAFWINLLVPGAPCRQAGQTKMANIVLGAYLAGWFLTLYFWGRPPSFVFQLILIMAHCYSLTFWISQVTMRWRRQERMGLMIACSLLVSLLIYGNLFTFLNESIFPVFRVNNETVIARDLPSDFAPEVGAQVIVHHDYFHVPGVFINNRQDTIQLIAGPNQTVTIQSNGYRIDQGELIPMSHPNLPQPLEINLAEEQWFGWSEIFLKNMSKIPAQTYRDTLLQLCIVFESDITGVPVESWFGQKMYNPTEDNP